MNERKRLVPARWAGLVLALGLGVVSMRAADAPVQANNYGRTMRGRALSALPSPMLAARL